MQDTYQTHQEQSKNDTGNISSPGKPEITAAENFRAHFPKLKGRKSALPSSLITIILVLAIWLVLFLTTGLKSFYMSTIMGICVGIVYGSKAKTKTSGVLPAVMVFIISAICTSAISLHLLSAKLEMKVQELKSFFGLQALAETILEQYTFWDVLFMVLAVFAAAYLAIRISNKRMYHYNHTIKTKKI